MDRQLWQGSVVVADEYLTPAITQSGPRTAAGLFRATDEWGKHGILGLSAFSRVVVVAALAPTSEIVQELSYQISHGGGWAHEPSDYKSNRNSFEVLVSLDWNERLGQARSTFTSPADLAEQVRSRDLDVEVLRVVEIPGPLVETALLIVGAGMGVAAARIKDLDYVRGVVLAPINRRRAAETMARANEAADLAREHLSQKLQRLTGDDSSLSYLEAIDRAYEFVVTSITLDEAGGGSRLILEDPTNPARRATFWIRLSGDSERIKIEQLEGIDV